jgi:iron(III) transport system ATP-binding protein
MTELTAPLPTSVTNTQPESLRAASQPATTVLSLANLTKTYQTPQFPAVDAFSLDVFAGEMLALLGPSGCGKTTLLRMLAGFEVPDAGSITLNGQVVSGSVAGKHHWVKPEKRQLGFVFQDYALFPHLTVLQNVMFGLHALPKRERLSRAKDVIDLVGLNIFSKRYPHQLSGGQQQRVALARALAPKPTVMLLDEPFSNLDAALRESTRDEVRRILKRSQTTAILVTHDQEEAMTFADRLVVMRQGHLEQLGKPEDVYLKPRTAFVANFLGHTNILRAQAEGQRADSALGELHLTKPASGSVMLSLRPEDIDFSDVPTNVPATVISRNFKGHDLTFVCQLEHADDDAVLPNHALSGAVQRNALSVTKSVIVHTGPRCPVQPGETVYLTSRGAAVPLEGSNKNP